MICQIIPKDKREFRSVIGLDNEQFIILTEQCSNAYKILKNQSYEEFLKDNPNGKNAKIKSIKDLVFYTLVILKSGITFDFAAFLMQFDRSRAHRQFKNGLHLLHYCLEIRGFIPLRSFQNPIEFEAQLNKNEPIIIDATEQKIQRPQDRELQNDTYSGKKKANTVKSMIISTLDRYIHYVSVCYVGRTHDYSLLKEEFNPDLNWFEGYQIRVDLGYQGFLNEYPKAELYIPTKKPRGGQLTLEQIENNKKLASERIYVEHSIGGIKRFDILSTPCRIHDFDIYDKMLGVCAGLWNFNITR